MIRSFRSNVYSELLFSHSLAVLCVLSRNYHGFYIYDGGFSSALGCYFSTCLPPKLERPVKLCYVYLHISFLLQLCQLILGSKLFASKTCFFLFAQMTKKEYLVLNKISYYEIRFIILSKVAFNSYC